MQRVPISALLLALAACGGGEQGSGDSGADQAPVTAQGRPTDGRWRPARPVETLTPEQRARAEELEAIGYVEGSFDATDIEGVTFLDEQRAQPGLNFLTSGHVAGALLMDMEGRTLHEWRRSYDEVWPDQPVPASNANRAFWRRATLLPEGDALAIFEGIGLVKLDRDSRVLWAARNRAHHDLAVLPSGEILVLTRVAHVVPAVHPTEPTLEDFVTRLSADGEELGRVSVLACYETQLPAIWRTSRMRVGDILHTNTLHWVDAEEARRFDFLAPGMVLVASPRVDVVAVLDLERRRMVRNWRGPFVALHDPKFEPDGSILLFDNQGADGSSRALAVDAQTGKPVWQYRGEPGDPLFSKTCGTATRLANGNVLIVESDNGRALEVTPAGERVWVFRSPWRVGPEREYVATLFDVARVPVGSVGWLERD